VHRTTKNRIRKARLLVHAHRNARRARTLGVETDHPFTPLELPKIWCCSWAGRRRQELKLCFKRNAAQLYPLARRRADVSGCGGHPAHAFGPSSL